MKIIGLDKDNFKGIGYLMFNGFWQDEKGFWNYDGKEDPNERHNRHLDISEENGLIKDGKFTVQFGVIFGTFTCFNQNMTSLRGAPIKCDEFVFKYNKTEIIDYLPSAKRYDLSVNSIRKINFCFDKEAEIISLEGNPNLSSFHGFPQNLYGLNIAGCGFTSFEGISNVTEYLRIENNVTGSLKGLENLNLRYLCADSCALETLEYCPHIREEAEFKYNNLKNLKGIKGEIVKNLSFDNNLNLKSLEGGENLKTKEYLLRNTSLISLEHINKNVTEIICTSSFLESVSFEKGHQDIKIQFSNCESINMYEFFKMGFDKDSLIYPTEGQKNQFKYRNVMEGTHRHPISSMTENEYYNDLFKYITGITHTSGKEKILETIESIVWFGLTKKVVVNYLASFRSISKYNM